MGIKDTIIKEYKACGTIKGTAKVVGVSEPTVRRVLIDAGEYSNETVASVSALREAGKSQKEICEILHLSESTVLGALPYTKGTYKDEPTVNALRIRKCRGKKEAKAQNDR